MNKTVPKVVKENGETITSQEGILAECKNFYNDLYRKRENINDIDLNVKLPYDDIPKLTNIKRNALEGSLTYPEITAAIKKMKTGKSPGSDGFTSEFIKFFWIDLGKFILRSINYGLNEGQMSITQKQGIITCIPKGDKPRQYLKNWRPISLLNTTYKLASSCIAERIKTVLPKLVSNDQTGFIPGRYIGEDTRLIYDILSYTEKK